MSVPITYRQKMDFSSCVKMVGFPKYGHIYIYICQILYTDHATQYSQVAIVISTRQMLKHRGARLSCCITKKFLCALLEFKRVMRYA